MIKTRSILAIVLGLAAIASWNYSTGRSYSGDIRGVDWSKYRKIVAHPVFPIAFSGGVLLLAMGIVLAKADIEKWRQRAKHD